MKDWKKTLISPSSPIMEAISIIDAGALQIALVVDENRRLIGVITDGDIRRAILNGVSLNNSVHLIMYRDFKTANNLMGRDEILELMKKYDLKHMPVVDENGSIVDLKVIIDLIDEPIKNNWVVIMAGGVGSRMKPLTNNCPKPLLKLNDKPIMEIILENLIKQGFKKIYISVNYKAEMIEDHFGDGSKWNVHIVYLREKKAMGTAGALGLLTDRPLSPLIVMNADLLTNINFGQLLDFHKEQKVIATMCVRNYHFQVPFGVVNLDRYCLRSINEKPIHNFFVNAGIYVLSPEVLEIIPRNESYDMTNLFQDLIATGREAIAFPVREYWLDIGRFDDYEKANAEYQEIFN